jgi:hypothetical protein
MSYQFAARRNSLITAFLLGMICCNLVLLYKLLPALRNGYQDFTIYYTAGRLLAERRAADLYNLRVQYETQLPFAHVPIRQAALPYNHPPFEAVLFVPLARLAYWPAYLLWSAINLIMLAASAMLLRRLPKIRELPPVMLGLACLAFFPVAIGLMQGQDIIFLLLMLAMGLTTLERGNEAAAGAWLAGGLIRPHMIVPLVLMLGLRRWRVLIGFIAVGLVLGAITVTIMGRGGPLEYVNFVLHVEKIGAGGFGPQAVPNLRGLVDDLPGIHVPNLHEWTANPVRPGIPSLIATALIAVSSLVVLGLAVRRLVRGNDSASYCFCLAAVTTILISFHALLYDLTMLLPLALFMLAAFVSEKTVDAGWERALLLLFLFCAPLYMYLQLDVDRFYRFVLILLWLFWRLLRTPPPVGEPA